MKEMGMKRGTIGIASLFAAFGLALALAGCPAQPGFPDTITPIYAATDSGLYVQDGSGWKNYTNASTGGGLASDHVSSVVVSGSGSRARVYIGTDTGISRFDGSAWRSPPWTTADGLGDNIIHNLFIGWNLYAATAKGVSVHNSDFDAATWTSDGSGFAVNDLYFAGSYSYVAADAQFDVYNGTKLKASFLPGAIISGSTRVTAVAVDSNQNVYVGTDQGLALYSGISSFFDFSLPAGSFVHGLFFDANGNLYAATSSGLYLNASGPPLLGGQVLSVYVDGAGTIYAGSPSKLQTSRNGGQSWTTVLGSDASPIKINRVLATAPLYSF